jgi:hypothetical protein
MDSGVSYVTGPFTSKEIDLDPGPEVDMHYKEGSTGSPEGFLIKLMEDGYW